VYNCLLSPTLSSKETIADVYYLSVVKKINVEEK
jgi:hypothetical protein